MDEKRSVRNTAGRSGLGEEQLVLVASTVGVGPRDPARKLPDVDGEHVVGQLNVG
jgi:hypothetical protein